MSRKETPIGEEALHALLGGLHVWSAEMAAHLLGCSHRAARAALERLVDHGLIRRHDQAIPGLPTVYYHNH